MDYTSFEEAFSGVKSVLSKNIKTYRKSKKISQQVLAEKTGLHRTYISDLENGKCNPTVNVLLAISICLEVSIEDLFRKTK